MAKYEGMHFDRRERNQDARRRLLGVGHVIIDRALTQLSDVDASLAVLPEGSLPGPLFVFRVSDRITDRSDLRPVVSALLRTGTDDANCWEMLHDWQLLELLNGLPARALAGTTAPSRYGGKRLLEGAHAEQAEAHMRECLPKLGLEFHVPFVELTMIVVPEGKGSL